ncbi:MAG: hypothetical protein U0235_28460 [Polyangiaceae bacterium]
MQSLLWSLAGTGFAILTCGLAVPVTYLVFHVLAALRLSGTGAAPRLPIVGDFSRGWVSMPAHSRALQATAGLHDADHASS